MPHWDELFAEGKPVARYPERAVQEFVSLLERSFAERPLRIWDHCCGAGRHTVAMASRGHRVFASDGSPRGVALLRQELAELGLAADTAVADMGVCPWPGAVFHGAVSWDSLHHNVVSGIRELFHGWDLSVLVERICDYRERSLDFLEVNPFDYTVWGVLARKPGGEEAAGA